MSSLTNNSPFSLDEINLRKKLVFPDGTIQSTAYTGAVAGATLAEVLADGNDANLQSIDNLASLTIVDAGGVNYSLIDQSTINLQIQSGSLSNTLNSAIKMIVTDGTGLDVQALTISNSAITVVPRTSFQNTSPPTAPFAVQPDSKDSSSVIPTTAWVQSAIQQRTAFLDLIDTANTISVTNSYTSPFPIVVVPLPIFPAKGQYLLSFSLNLELSGTTNNMICRETISSTIPGQIATGLVIPYQYPIAGSVFDFLGTGVYISGTYILNTLVAEATGLSFNLECAWTNSGTVSCNTQNVQITYLGSSTGAV